MPRVSSVTSLVQCCNVMQCGVVRCSAVQRGAVWCSELQCVALWCHVEMCCIVLQCGQCVALSKFPSVTSLVLCS